MAAGIIGIISALLPIIGKLIDVFSKTPEEKLLDVKESLLKYVEDVGAGLKHMKQHDGDTSVLEKVLNKAKH